MLVLHRSRVELFPVTLAVLLLLSKRSREETEAEFSSSEADDADSLLVISDYMTVYDTSALSRL
jgi:hypothetical protein